MKIQYSLVAALVGNGKVKGDSEEDSSKKVQAQKGAFC